MTRELYRDEALLRAAIGAPQEAPGSSGAVEGVSLHP
jgi:hypothetical protein